uniref:Uncharacterized protein n=1 Tax=Octopus bimaculoides TaxID=37653 RepID=A0A0L8H8E1_OCTBM
MSIFCYHITAYFPHKHHTCYKSAHTQRENPFVATLNFTVSYSFRALISTVE